MLSSVSRTDTFAVYHLIGQYKEVQPIMELEVDDCFHANLFPAHQIRVILIMADTKKKVDLGLLEEDDEFEEFPAEGEIVN